MTELSINPFRPQPNGIVGTTIYFLASLGLFIYYVREIIPALRTGEFRRSLLNPYGPSSRRQEPILYWFQLCFASAVTIAAMAFVIVGAWLLASSSWAEASNLVRY